MKVIQMIKIHDRLDFSQGTKISLLRLPRNEA